MLKLPAHIRRVESHLTWMEDFLHFLEDSKGKHFVERILYAQAAEIHKELNFDDNFPAEYSNQNPKYVSYYATWLNHAGLACYLGEFEKAENVLDKLQLSLKQLTINENHKRVLKGIKYSLGVMVWSVTRLKLSDKNENCENQLDQWKAIQENVTALATMEFFKGSLANYLGMTAGITLEHFQKAVELDPDYFVWHHYSYRKMREIRRIQSFTSQQQQCLIEQLKKERDIAEVAYEKSVSSASGEMNLMSLIDLAIAMKETLNVTVAKTENAQTVWDEKNEVDYEKCWNLLSEGIKIARENKLENLVSTIMILQAEFLLYLKPWDQEKQARGKQLLFECLEKYPDSRIHQKIGKLYQQEANSDITQIWRYRKARYHFAESLKLDSGNFGCLKAYIMLLNNIPDRQTDDYKESLNTLRKCSSVVKRSDYESAQVHMFLGCLLWIFNPEYTDNNKQLACKEWLHVAKHLPEYLDDLIKHLLNPPFKVSYKSMRRDPVHINIKRIMAELIELRRKQSIFANWKESTSHIDLFYDKLKVYVEIRESGQYGDTIATQSGAQSTFKTEMSEVVHNQRRRINRQENKARLNLKCDKSLADMDSNWRSGKQ